MCWGDIFNVALQDECLVALWQLAEMLPGGLRTSRPHHRKATGFSSTQSSDFCKFSGHSRYGCCILKHCDLVLKKKKKKRSSNIVEVNWLRAPTLTGFIIINNTYVLIWCLIISERNLCIFRNLTCKYLHKASAARSIKRYIFCSKESKMFHFDVWGLMGSHCHKLASL